eukprot:608765-Rhodomonas_salina.2
MRVRVLRFLGREACACVLGGLAYDDGAPMVVNLLHLYIFLIFFLTPYAVASAFEGSSFFTALLLLTKSRDEPLEQQEGTAQVATLLRSSGAQPTAAATAESTEGPTLEQACYLIMCYLFMCLACDARFCCSELCFAMWLRASYAMSGTPRNRTQETAISVQFVLGMRCADIAYGASCSGSEQSGASRTSSM